MEDTKMILGYCEWIIIVGLSIGLFNYFSKSKKNVFMFMLLSFLIVWVVIAIIRGLENFFLEKVNEVFSFKGILFLMADTIAQMIVFGGITLIIKYLKFRKTVQLP